MRQVLDLHNGAVSEKSPQIFCPALPFEYVTLILGRTDAPKVRCGRKTDRHTDRQTPAAHAHRGLIKIFVYIHVYVYCI